MGARARGLPGAKCEIVQAGARGLEESLVPDLKALFVDATRRRLRCALL